MAVIQRRWHEFRRFVAGIAEHQALIACALLFWALAINALINIRALLADHIDDRAGVAIKANVRVVVTDIGHDFTRDGFDINPSRSRDFTSNNHRAGFCQGFTSDPRIFILRQNRV